LTYRIRSSLCCCPSLPIRQSLRLRHRHRGEWLGEEFEYHIFGRSLFPIEYRNSEAVVRMPENDLWLGQEVPLEWFKNWLRERIAEYRSW
jgi:hypothetical protein